MKILYYGSFCDDAFFNKFFNKKTKPSSFAQYNFESALLSGMVNLNEVTIDASCIYQDSYFPKSNCFIFRSKKKTIKRNFSVRYIPYLNFTLIRELCFFLFSFIYTFLWCLKNIKHKEKSILTSFSYVPVSIGIILAAKIFKVKRINIYTDLSSMINTKENLLKISYFKRCLKHLYLDISNSIDKRFDGYIFFTKQMDNIVNTNRRPFIVIEGIFNSNNINLKSSTVKKKSIMYAGSLYPEAGVDNIIDAFKLLSELDIELWIFGNEEYKDHILEKSGSDNRIKFWGFRPREEIFEYEKVAQLLINARNPKDEFTKYSFPSKTFEYMASGTPLLTTKLPGIPEEYYNYVFTINEFTTEGIKNSIEEVLSKPKEDMFKFGLEAQKFILNKKNSTIQSQKVIEFLSTFFTKNKANKGMNN
jgi:glycosyltransferase involved in cell wall biosynthesis